MKQSYMCLLVHYKLRDLLRQHEVVEERGQMKIIYQDSVPKPSMLPTYEPFKHHNQTAVAKAVAKVR